MTNDLLIFLLTIIAGLIGAFLGILAWFLRRELSKNDAIHQKLWNKISEIYDKLYEKK